MKLELMHGDSLEHMRNMPDNTVDLIITSPPYADARKTTYGGVAVNEYVEWFLPFSKEMLRILKPTGSFILNIKEKVVKGERHTYVMELVIALRKQGWLFTEEYMWHKTTTTPGKWPNRFRDLWEHLYHFTKQRKFTMNQEAVKVPIGDWSKTRLKNLSETDMRRDNSRSGSSYGKNVSNWVGKETVYPGNVLHGSSETRNTGHPAAFPVWLPEWFIKLFTNPGDAVYDPFLGSGATALAAIRNGRAAYGSELLEDYLDIARRRCESEIHQNMNN